VGSAEQGASGDESQSFVEETVDLPRGKRPAFVAERPSHLCGQRQLVVDRLQVAHRIKLGLDDGRRDGFGRRDSYPRVAPLDSW